MDPERTTILFGPPGTGKTTNLIKIVEDNLNNGIGPNEIIFIAFTRKAANEAKERAVTSLKLDPDQLPWFKTLHALAFQILMLDRRNVMAPGDYFKIANMLGLSITARGFSSSEDGLFATMTKGDRLFFMENMSRARRMGLKEYWEEYPNEDVYWYELERLQKTLENYKQLHGKLDFTDMVKNFIRLDSGNLGARVLIVDEAQDLSPLQWEMVDILAKHVEQVYLAGDDDQAIFRWAGADVDHLIETPGERRVLMQSYRVPAEVQQLANTITARIQKRVPKAWNPRQAIGTVEYVTALEQIDMSKGRWLLLARNAFLLDQYTHHCMREGYVFDSVQDSIIRSESYRAIVIWERLLKGEHATAAECKVVYSMISTKVGIRYGSKKRLDELADRTMLTISILCETYGLITSGPWYEALDKLTAEEKQYFQAAKERGEEFQATPRIKISTIHGVKGGEADNVVLCTDMALRSWMEFQQQPDDEHRVWYVAVTRAREKLFILQATTNKAYDI